MDVLVIEPNNKSNYKLLLELAKKLGSKVKTVKKEDDVATQILKGLEDAKSIEEGKTKGKTLKQFLDGK
ncbi:MAG: hypothetical protein N4A71_11055 [Carboxylicivirga sp.]|jgi:4-hydroxy-3-methylbut-2-enyl diphosphate reductase IspH|nr:hypothetical protein [Carboxylicivirga sp.]